MSFQKQSHIGSKPIKISLKCAGDHKAQCPLNRLLWQNKTCINSPRLCFAADRFAGPTFTRFHFVAEPSLHERVEGGNSTGNSLIESFNLNQEKLENFETCFFFSSANDVHAESGKTLQAEMPL